MRLSTSSLLFVNHSGSTFTLYIHLASRASSTFETSRKLESPPRLAEAACKTTVQAARAVVSEVPEAASSSIGALASCSLSNSERDVHILAQKFSLALPLQLQAVVTADKEEIPILPLSTWARFILDKGLFFSLSGLHEPSDVSSTARWRLFCQRYKAIYPNHQIFEQRTMDELERTAGLILHGDEGRSKKKTPVMILSAHSILGKGSHCSSSTQEEHEQRLNFIGHTWATRWLLSVLPREMYDDHRKDNFQQILSVLVDDYTRLVTEGLQDRFGRRHFFAVLHVAGDWPFHGKAFELTRTFQNAAKAPTASRAPRGICHVCLADQVGFPWEDFSSAEPRWRRTMGVQDPFARPPCLMKLLHDRSNKMALVGQDLFHGWHLGAGKVFMSSAVAVASYFFEGSSIEARLANLANHFFSWCRRTKQQPYIRKLTKDTINWHVAQDAPSGGWSKGSTTVVMIRWLVAWCRERAGDIPEDSLLRLCYKAAQSINLCMSKLYREQVWIPSDRAVTIAQHGMDFLLRRRAAILYVHAKSSQAASSFLGYAGSGKIGRLRAVTLDSILSVGGRLYWPTQSDF